MLLLALAHVAERKAAVLSHFGRFHNRRHAEVWTEIASELRCADRQRAALRRTLRSHHATRGGTREGELMATCCECKLDIPDLEIGGHVLPPQDLTQNGDEPLLILPVCKPCYRWLERVHHKDDPKVVRAAGHSYYLGIGNALTPPSWRGHAGAAFLVEYLDGRPSITTVDLWHHGEVPAHFRDRLPDTATLRQL